MNAPPFPIALTVLMLGLTEAGPVMAQPKKPMPQQVRHQITGLFSRDREQDLRAIMAEVPNIKLIRVDFEHAEAVFEYDPAVAFPNMKPERLIQRFDEILRSASHSTFGVKPLRTTPLDKLKLIEIPIAGLDCKACSLAAYEAIYRLEGVERATASFRDRKVSALIDPAKTDRSKLEDALRKRQVDVKKH